MLCVYRRKNSSVMYVLVFILNFSFDFPTFGSYYNKSYDIRMIRLSIKIIRIENDQGS